MGDSVPKHTGPNSLTDTHPRTEHLQNPTAHHRSKPQRWKSLLLSDAQAACRCNCWASKPTPFFQMVKLMAAIFRARVRRAIVGASLSQPEPHKNRAAGQEVCWQIWQHF